MLRRFYRLERSRTTPGSGLGLSMASAVAALHHGTFEILDNAPGLRAVVRFQFPAATLKGLRTFYLLRARDNCVRAPWLPLKAEDY